MEFGDSKNTKKIENSDQNQTQDQTSKTINKFSLRFSQSEVENLFQSNTDFFLNEIGSVLFFIIEVVMSIFFLILSIISEQLSLIVSLAVIIFLSIIGYVMAKNYRIYSQFVAMLNTLLKIVVCAEFLILQPNEGTGTVEQSYQITICLVIYSFNTINTVQAWLQRSLLILILSIYIFFRLQMYFNVANYSIVLSILINCATFYKNELNERMWFYSYFKEDQKQYRFQKILISKFPDSIFLFNIRKELKKNSYLEGKRLTFDAQKQFSHTMIPINEQLGENNGVINSSRIPLSPLGDIDVNLQFFNQKSADFYKIPSEQDKQNNYLLKQFQKIRKEKFTKMQSNMESTCPVTLEDIIERFIIKKKDLQITDSFLNQEGFTEENYSNLQYVSTDFQKPQFLDATLTMFNFQKKIYLLLTLKDISGILEERKLNDIQQYKEHVLATFTHNLQTPLNCIMLMCQPVKRQKQTAAELEEKVQNIKKSGRYLITVINDIIDYSRSLNSKLYLNLSNFCVDKLLDQLMDVMGSQFQRNEVEFHQQIDNNDRNSFICSDRQRLFQILVNLVGNAFQFTFKGQVEVRVAQKLDFTEFQIVDTGIGFTQDIKLQLLKFEVGNLIQIDEENDAIQQTSGSGMGLVMCNNLVQKLGGQSLSIESEVGKGSVFSFIIQNSLSSSESPDSFIPRKMMILNKKKNLLESVYQSMKKEKLHSLKEQNQANADLKHIDLKQSILPDILEQIKSENNLSSMNFGMNNIKKKQADNDNDESENSQYIQSFDKQSVDEEEIYKKMDRYSRSNLNSNTFMKKSNNRSFSIKSIDLMMSQFSEQKLNSIQFLENQEEDKQESTNPPSPLKKQLMRSIQTSLKPQLKQQVRHFFQKNPRVLIVDDTLFNILCLKSLLLEFDVSEIEEVFNGQQAIELMDIKIDSEVQLLSPFDIIFMDINMPLMDGFTATKIIKKVLQNFVYVVFVSAFNDKSDQKKAKDAGGDFFLEKPVNLNSLNEMVVQLNRIPKESAHTRNNEINL